MEFKQDSDYDLNKNGYVDFDEYFKKVNLQFALQAEKALRYDDMMRYMKQVTSAGRLSSNERIMFEEAYKYSFSSRRDAWLIVSKIQNEES